MYLNARISLPLVFTARHYASAVCRRRVSVCVCLSVTLQYSIKMAKHRIMQIMPHDSPWIIGFWCRQIERDHPY